MTSVKICTSHTLISILHRSSSLLHLSKHFTTLGSIFQNPTQRNILTKAKKVHFHFQLKNEWSYHNGTDYNGKKCCRKSELVIAGTDTYQEAAMLNVMPPSPTVLVLLAQTLDHLPELCRSLTSRHAWTSWRCSLWPATAACRWSTGRP